MYAISANSLPTIRTHQQAQSFWTTAPKQDGYFRALNPKRKSDSSKRIWSPDDGKTIRFRLHHTDLVEYTESTVSVTCYDSQSSIIFVGELAPHEIRAHNYRGGMWVNRMQPADRALVFNKTEKGYEVDKSTVSPQYKIVTDKKISLEVSKLLRPFLKYRAARAALHRQRLPTGPMRPLPWLVDQLIRDLVKEEAWSDLYVATGSVSAEAMHRELVWRAVGIKKDELPIGVMPTKSVYDGYSV